MTAITWTPRSSPFGDSGLPVQALVKAGARLIAGGIGSPHIMVSDDEGATWGTRASPFDALAGGVFGLAYSDNLDRVVAVGGETAVQLMYSDDQGETWTLVTVDATLDGSLSGVARDDGQGFFVAVATGSNNLVVTSSDGIAWVIRATPWDGTGFAAGVCYAGGTINKWVVVGVNYFGDGTTAMTAPDPTSTWTEVAAGPFDGAVGWAGYGQGQAVAFDGTNVAAGSYSGTTGLSTSPDGANWTDRPSGLDGAIVRGIAVQVGRLLALGENGIFESVDGGVTWTADPTSPFTAAFGPGSGSGGWAGVFLGLDSAVAGGIDDAATVAVATGAIPTPIQPPTQVFGGTRFYEAPPWRMVVSDLEDNILTFLDRLALDRSVTVTRAASRVISGRVPSDNPEVNIPAVVDDEPFVSEGARLVSCFRREAPVGSNEAPWVIRGRGVVLSMTDDADTDHATSTFVAYDPWKYLYRRPVLQVLGDVGDVSYPAGTRANEIIIEQFDLAILNGTFFTDYGQTAFYAGTIENTEPLPDGGDGLAMTFRSGTTLGEMLDLLVATGTCDVVFDPIYDIDNRPGILCELSIYQSAGSFKPNAVMGWDRWPRSVVQLSRQVEGTERANMVQMYAGQGGPPVPLEQDAMSIARFGEYWALQYLPGVPSIAGAHTIAQRQLALLKDGQYTYALSPASERAPLLFEEYREADTVPVYASDRFRDPISGVPLRVESIPIVIGDDSLERVNQMLVSFAPESGS